MLTKGATRWVWLTRRWALKFPSFSSFRNFLHGLLANDQEVMFSRAGWPELCPICFHLPLGLLVVMPRTRPLSDHEFAVFNYRSFTRKPDYQVPVERKPDSFGWYQGRIVAIDYGS